jgi:hypothetical protein
VARCILLALWALSSGGCQRLEGARSRSHREPARYVLEARCGTCHRGDQPTAVQGALRVFDLTQADFAAGMSRRQLEDLVGRLRGMGAEEVDLAPVRDFVAAQVARRR